VCPVVFKHHRHHHPHFNSTLCLFLSFSSSSHGFHQFSHHCLVWYFSFTLFIFFIFSLIHSHFKNPPVFFCRGSGEDGQLGIGTNEDKEWVCTVKALPSQRVRSVVAGSRNSLAICHDGKVINISQVVTLFWDMETTYDLSIG
jgi:hypothetical protein